jgi:RarD protein
VNQLEDKGRAGSRVMYIAAMTVFGTVGLFVRGIPLPSAEIALYRAAIALVVIGIFMVFTGRCQLLQTMGRDLWRYALSGVFMGANWILLFEAYQYTSIALATLSYYIAPTLMVLASVVFFKERLSLWQVVCFVLSTAGLVLMVGVSGGSGDDLKGILLGMAAAVLYASVVMMNKAAGNSDGIVRTFVQFLAAVLVLAPFVALRGGFNLGALDGSGWLNLMILGLVHTGLCYCLYFISLAHMRGQQAAILSYLDPLMAVLLSVIWLGEKVSPVQLIGGGVMLLFALLNELSGRKK